MIIKILVSHILITLIFNASLRTKTKKKHFGNLLNFFIYTNIYFRTMILFNCY